MVKKLAGLCVGLLCGVMATAAPAQSLADVARQAAARRQGDADARGGKSTKVLTNADLPASAIVAPARAPADAQEPDTVAPAHGGTDAAAAEVRPDAAPAAQRPAAAPTDDEAGWRDRAGRVNAAVAAAEAQLRQLKALSDRLSLEEQASNPAIAARAQAERAQLRAQIAHAAQKAAEAQSLHAALAHEARTAGVPPPWIQ